MTEAVGPGWGDLARIAGALAFVVALALLFGLLARRGTFSGKRRRLALIERLPVARGAQVVLVADGERTLLLGVSEKGVSLIRDVGPAAPEPAAAEAEPPPRIPFAERLVTALRARGGS